MQKQKRYFCEGVGNAWHNLQVLFSLTVVRGKQLGGQRNPFLGVLCVLELLCHGQYFC